MAPRAEEQILDLLVLAALAKLNLAVRREPAELAPRILQSIAEAHAVTEHRDEGATAY
jgi:hypothetical protein